MPDVVCTGVARRYATAAGVVEALRGLDATFRAGQMTALVGPSGSGKSTLLRLIAGVDAPSGGAIRIGAVDVAALRGASLRRHRRRTVTYVAQRAAANLVPHLTLRQQLDGGTAVATELGLAAHLDARAAELSGGEQARAAVAVAVARATPVLLVDEPTAELDRATASHVLETLRAAAAAGVAVVAATHDVEAVSAADAVVDLTDRRAPDRPALRPEETSGDTVLWADRLCKSYEGAHALVDASLEVRAGEIVVLLGRSGSGKSTLLMIAGGWLHADRGTVELAGRPLAGRPPWRQLAYVPQRLGLLPELSVAENVALPSRLAGGRRDDSLLELLGLAELACRAPAETSVGQQQRTALARGLGHRPLVLVADEPTSHQDARSAASAWDAIVAARNAGTACLIATHDEAAAERADRVYRIADGVVSAGGRP